MLEKITTHMHVVVIRQIAPKVYIKYVQNINVSITIPISLIVT